MKTVTRQDLINKIVSEWSLLCDSSIEDCKDWIEAEMIYYSKNSARKEEVFDATYNQCIKIYFLNFMKSHLIDNLDFLNSQFPNGRYILGTTQLSIILKQSDYYFWELYNNIYLSNSYIYPENNAVNLISALEQMQWGDTN